MSFDPATHEARCLSCNVGVSGDAGLVARWTSSHAGALYLEGSLRSVVAGCASVVIEGQGGHNVQVRRVNVVASADGAKLTRD